MTSYIAGALLAEHVPLDVTPLFEGRDCRRIDLDNLADAGRQQTLPAHTWMLTGAGARRISDPPLKPLTLEEVEARREHAATADGDSASSAAPGATATPATAAPLPAAAGVSLGAGATTAQVAVSQAAGMTPRHAALLDYQTTMQAFIAGNERVVAQAMGLRTDDAAQPPVAPTAQRPQRRLANRLALPTAPAADKGAAPDAAPAPQPEPAQAVSQTAGPLPRFVLRPQAEAIDGIAADALAAGGWLLTADTGGVAAQLKTLMERETGVVPVLVDPDAVNDAERFAACAAAARSVAGGLRGLIHLAPLDLAPLAPGAGLDDWRAQGARADKALFLALKHCADELRGAGATVLAASALGGLMGRGNGAPGLVNGGGGSGLLKCVNEEWETGRLRAVDLDAARPADENARHLLAELRLRGGRIEVGYRDGRRYVFRTVPSPLRTEGASAVRSASRDWVVLASGGARGITAELLRDLAKAGVTLVITGRTPEPPDEDEATRKLTTDAELKAHLIREARAAGEEVRPVEVQRKLGRLRNEREMRANLSDLRAAGATIDYRVCDMADPDATAELFAALYRDYGRLDGVVHGAGIIEDKLLVDKTPQSWFRVFDIKADSAFLLARHLRPDTLRFVTLFTSVAGRYGNSGQTDYAAANEVVNRAAWSLQRRFGDAVKVSAINWGPWAATRHGQGMVSAEAERKFAARGVHLVYPQAGRELFMHEITTAPTHEVEVIAGSGPWEQVESDYGRLAEGLAIDPPVAAARRPLLAQAAFRTGTEDRRVASRTVRLSSDLYLDQHLINSTPVMPAAVAVEMMAQAALSYCPDYVITEMSDIRLFNGIRFTSDEIAIAIVANIGTVGADDDRIAVDLALYPAGAKGRPSYRATAHLNGAPLKRPVYQSLLKPAGSPLSAREAYQRVLFHGPCFQNIEELRGLDRQGAVCGLKRTPPMDLWLSAPPDGAEWLFDPGCLDAAAQLGVVYGNVLNGESALPNSFARVRRFGDAPIPACTMYFLAHPEQPEHRIRADVAFVDDEGKLRLFVEQLECTSSEALNSIGGGWKGRISV